MNKKLLFLGLVFVFVVGFLLISPLLNNVSQGSKEELNVFKYSSTVSSDRPKVFLDVFAQTMDVPQQNTVNLVLYQQGMAVVDETRSVSFEKGLNLLNFGDVPSTIDVSSVLFQDLKFPDSKVIEQVYQYDTASENSLLEKFLGKEITINATEGNESKQYVGKLLSYDSGITLETANGVVVIKNIEKIVFPKEENLLTKPTLVLKVFSQNVGQRDVRLSYLSNGFDWSAKYVAKLNESDDSIELTGNVLVSNNSGTNFSKANLTLLAGQVNTVSTGGYRNVYAMESKATPAADYGGSFSQASSFEYHTYTLDHATSLNDKESKQINLLSSKSVPVVKEYVFDGFNSYYGSQSSPESVDVKISFKNEEANGLGMPLPAGTVRVYKESNGVMQFLGEDSIDHTPKGIERKLSIGKAFDITAEKKTISTQQLNNCSISSYEVKLKNAKKENVSVKVLQNVYGDSTILESSLPSEKLDAYRFQFSVPVNAEGETTLTYTVKSC